MKKGLKRLVAGMLCALTLTSCYAGLATVAAEESESAVTQATMTEAAAAEAESNTANTADEEIEFHGATGDLSTEADLEGVEKIETVSDYYEVTGNDTKPQARMRSAATLPSKVDNSDSEYFPEVDSQGSIGSCTAWALVYYQFTYEMNKSMGRKTTPENTFSPKWAYNMVNEGVDEGSRLGDIYSVLKYQGAATLEQIPYDSDYLSWSPDEDIWSSTGDYRITDYQELKYGRGNTPITSPDDEDLEVIKTALSNGDILTYSTYIYSWNYSRLEKNEEVPENDAYAGESIATAQIGSNGSHRMTIVGYNDDIWVDINGDGSVQEQEKGAFKIVNSWGKDFANDGFCWVAYDALNKVSSVPNMAAQSERCSIFENIARIDVEPYDSDSDIILTYKLNSSDREQTKIYVIAENESERIEKEVVPYCCTYGFGSYSYDGTKSSNDGTMCFDLGNVVEGLNSSNFTDYTWSIKVDDEDADNTVLTVKELKITDKNTGKVYEADGSLPIALDGQTETMDFYRTANTPTATIYYSGYSNPYIHYQVGNGRWTTAPGVKMEASSEMSGYTHKYTINLGSEGYANVCFNDGGSSWDNNGGNNYRFEDGTYTFKNGIITPVEVDDGKFGIASFTITPENGQIYAGEYVTMRVALKNATSMAVCQYLYVKDGDEYVIYNYSGAISGLCRFAQPGTYTLMVKAKENPYSTKVVTAEKTITVLPELTEENSATIYYKGYSDPYIHYQVGSGSWTTAPGVKMEESSEVSGFTHKYVIYIGDQGYANVCFNDGGSSWDTNGGNNYKFEPGKYTYQNGVITQIGNKKLEIESVKFTPENSGIGIYEIVKGEVHATGGTAPYQYQFASWRYGELTILQDYSEDNTFSHQFIDEGPYNLIVNVKDAAGTVVSNSDTHYTVMRMYVLQLNPDKETAQVGQSVTFTPKTTNEASVFTAENYFYTVTKDGNTQNLTTNSDKTVTWTPTEAGDYTVKLEVKYGDKLIYTKSVNYTVAEASETEKITIFYKGYSTPYIHYQVGSGSWTTAPGVKMDESSEMSGYTHKYTIYLGTQSYANVCFNNGSGSWDSNGGNNYRFESGTYTYENGVITPVDNDDKFGIASFTITPESGQIYAGESVTMRVALKNSTSSAVCQFLYVKDGEEHVIYDYAGSIGGSYQFSQPGVYTLMVKAKESLYSTEVVTAEKTITVLPKDDKFGIESFTITPENGQIYVGESVQMRVALKNSTSSAVCQFLYVKNGNEHVIYDYVGAVGGSYQFSQPGTYTLMVKAKDNPYSTEVVTAEKTVTVLPKPGENSMTIYYKGYSTPYIHYQIGSGSWTAVPGVKMEESSEMSGYTHKYTIDLGTESYANVCFNNGSGNWDSNGGRNYRFEAGTYTYENGKLTKIG